MAPRNRPRASAPAGEEAKHRLRVRARPPLGARWRAGTCFGAQPRMVEVDGNDLALILADPYLIAEEAE